MESLLLKAHMLSLTKECPDLSPGKGRYRDATILNKRPTYDSNEQIIAPGNSVMSGGARAFTPEITLIKNPLLDGKVFIYPIT